MGQKRLKLFILYAIFVSLVLLTGSTSRAEFYWHSPYFDPVGAGTDNAYDMSKTSLIYYNLFLGDAQVGDTFKWYWYNPVIDPKTGFPTNEMELYTYITPRWVYQGSYWWFWKWPVSDYLYTSDDSLWLGTAIYVNGYSPTHYPGKWRVDITRTSGGVETLLTSGYFTLIDDIKPSVSFVSPTNGATLTGRQDVTILAYDNVKVTSVDLYAKHKETGQMYSLGTIGSVGRDGYWHYTWATGQYPLGNYTLIAQAHDPYGNMSNGNGSIDVMSYPVVAVTAITATNNVELPGVTAPEFSAQFAPSGNTAGVIVNKNDPIAALVNSTFNLNVTVRAFPGQSTWAPVVEWKYSLLGNSNSGSFTGWNGTIPISTAVSRVSDRTFQDKDLKLTFIIKDPNTGHAIRRQTVSIVFKPKAVKIMQYKSVERTENTAADFTFVSQDFTGSPSLITVTATTGNLSLDSQISWRVYSDPSSIILSGNPTPDPVLASSSHTFSPNPPPATSGRIGPLSYVIEATVTVAGSSQTTVEIITQDNLDELRQEYIDLPDRVPQDRIEFDKDAPAYAGLLGAAAEPSRFQWHILRNLNQHAVDTDSQYTGDLRVTSGYRTPVGNSQLSGSAATSNHQYGKALDFNQQSSSENYDAFEAALVAGAAADSYLRGSNGILYFWQNNPPQADQLPQGVTYVQGHVAWE
jgi:hypothetical protein